MDKQGVLKEIANMIAVIAQSPELFHDGIDEEIMELLLQTKTFIEKEIK